MPSAASPSQGKVKPPGCARGAVRLRVPAVLGPSTWVVRGPARRRLGFEELVIGLVRDGGLREEGGELTLLLGVRWMRSGRS